MTNSLVTCALWRAACSTATEISDGLSVAAARPKGPSGPFGRRRSERVRIEPLEDRLLYSGVPFVSGANSAEAGVAYNLNLSPNGKPIDHWTVDWGDGANGQADAQTFAGSASTASHVYLQGGSDTITATAYKKNGKVLSTTSLGVVPAGQTDGVMEITQAELTEINGQNVTVESVAVEPNGQMLVLTTAGLDRFNADGSLDTTFGSGGVAALPAISGAAGRALTFSMVDVNGDGQIAIGGAGKKAWDIAQYSTAGRLARTRSVVASNLAAHPAQAVSLDFQNHEVILLGQDQSGNNVYWMSNLTGGGTAAVSGQDTAWAYDQGAIDNAAGGDGSSWLVGSDGTNFYVAHYSSTGTELSASQVTNDTSVAGGAVAVGLSGDLLVGRQFLSRYLPSGALDPTFGTGGQVLLPTALQGQVTRIVNLADGQILVVGEGFQTLARYNSDGTLDTTFGAGGVLSTGLMMGATGSLMQLSGGNYQAADTDGFNVFFETVTSTSSALTVQAAPAPSVSISGGASAYVGTSYALNLSAVYPANDPDPGTISSWVINWGDGTANSPDLQTVSGSTTSVQHVFTFAASDVITATATDQFGSYVTNPVNTSVIVGVPDVSISGGPAADAGLAYQLNLSGVYPSGDPSGAVNSWVINWGDGTAGSPDLQTVSGTVTSVEHTFTAAATDQVIATATDQFGSYITNTMNLPVNAGAPTIASFQVNGGNLQRVTVTSLTVAFSQPVTLASNSLTLVETDNVSGSPTPLPFDISSPDGGTTYVLTFSDPSDTGGSLPNGTYNLTVDPSGVSDLAGAALTAGATYSFYRLDNGSADGGLEGISDNNGLSFNPLASLNAIPYVTAGSPLTIGVTAAPYGNNGDLLGFQWTVLNPQGKAFALPNGGTTTAPSLTFIPNVAGTWSVALTVTDKALLLSTTINAQSFSVAQALPAYTYSTPSSNPASPSGWDTFTPTMGGSPASGTPVIDASDLTAAADNSIVVTGNLLTADTGSAAFSDTQFLVYGQTGANNGTLSNGTIQAATTDGVTVTVSAAEVSDSMFLAWPVNANGVGAPTAINATDATWVGPGTASVGQTVSVYGQNLSNSAATPQSWVYLQPSGGGAGTWATVTAVNPYQVQFTVPSNLANGTYQVWVNNGLGGKYGWSQAPTPLTLVTAMAWPSQFEVNVKNYGAVGNGVADDGPAIASAIAAIQTLQTNNSGANATLYFPAGTYLVTSVEIVLPYDVRVLGDGENSSKLVFNGNLAAFNSQFDRGPFAIGNYDGWTGHLGATNIEFDSLSMSYTGTSSGQLIRQNYGQNLTLNNVLLSVTSGVEPISWQGSDQVKLENSTVIGGEIQLLAVNDAQIVNDSFYLAYNIEAAIAIWAGSDISIAGCSAQDYNEQSSTGWGLGRILEENCGWGSIYNIYFGGNSTINLGTPNYNNTGEQILSEGPGDWAYGAVTSATTNTVTIPVSSETGGTPGAGESIVVTSGTGVGELAQITSVTQNGNQWTLGLAANWTVIPDSTSLIDVCSTQYNSVYYDNSFQDQTGTDGMLHLRAAAAMEIWTGAYNVVFADNTVNNMVNGIVLSSAGGHNPISFVQVTGNQFNNDQQSGVSINPQAVSPGVLELGLIVRGNVINGAGGTQFGGAGIAVNNAGAGPLSNQSVIEDNTIENAMEGMYINDDPDVLVYKNTFMAGTFAGGGSVGIGFVGSTTGIILEDDIFQNYAQTYTGTVPASVLTQGSTGGALQSIPVFN